MSAAKKLKVAQKFRDEYTRIWPFIKPSKLGDEYALCEICDADIKISSGARSDLDRHIKTPKHAKRFSAKSVTPSVLSLFTKTSQGQTLDQETTSAELLFSTFLVEHNLPLAVADHAGDLFRAMFPDSDIAKNFKCGRTKTRKLVGAIAADTTERISNSLKSVPFSLSTDGSNDRGSEQLYPIVVRYHDSDSSKVVTDVLSIPTPDGSSSGENIFKALDGEMTKHGLSWDNCISFGADNASVMLGHLNGVAAHINSKNSETLIQGCPCHLLHIAAKKGAEALQCPTELTLIDIFHYLENSSKRMKELREFQQESGTAIRKIIKHGPTRWLSLHNCVNRIVEQWQPLSAFFASEKTSVSTVSARLNRICTFFEDASSKLYCLFLKFVLPKFINANLLLQKEEPVIHLIRRRLHEVATDLLVAFVKPSAISSCNDIYALEHHRRSKRKERENLQIGEDSRAYLEVMKGNGLSNTAITTFFSDVRSFYSSALAYVFAKMPLQKEALEHAEVLDISLRSKMSMANIRYWTSRFKCIQPAGGMDQLEQEFCKYQVDPAVAELDKQERVDILWSKIGCMKSDEELKYPNLAALMKSLCALPHSNADSERVFSLIRKNKTESRASMSRQLLNDLTIVKMEMISRNKICNKVKFSSAFLTKVKKLSQL